MKRLPLLMSGLLACGDFLEPAATTSNDDGGEVPGDVEPRLVTHYFGDLSLPPQTDDATRCVSWRLDNDAPLYVQSVILDNEGSFHHSNWLVVHEDDYPGADGYFNCADRGFEEVSAAQRGTVLFAQSTQSFHEEQNLTAGAVIKIPPRHKVIATLHTLNSSPLPDESGLWLTLRLIHPRAVRTVVTAMSMQYKALAIPPQTEARFTGKCDLSVAQAYADPLHPELSLRLHYLLPHYHYLGNYFDVKVIGGPLDGTSIYTFGGFNGVGNGKTFDPPLDLPGATGLQFTCGYDNWKNQSIQWGNGDGEMCVLLALVENTAKLGASVDTLNTLVSQIDGVQYYEGLCLAAGVAKGLDQGMPSDAERDAPIYVPPHDPDDEIPPLPTCRDADTSRTPDAPITLTRLRDTLFAPSCTFSSCHGQNAVAGLDLQAHDLHARLLNHDVGLASDLPLVAPGDPEGSLLYQLVSRCEPKLSDGSTAAHMPLNAPILLDDAVIAELRAWIEAGALDN